MLSLSDNANDYTMFSGWQSTVFDRERSLYAVASL